MNKAGQSSRTPSKGSSDVSPAADLQEPYLERVRNVSPAADPQEPYLERVRMSTTSSVSVLAIGPRGLTDSVPASTRPRSSSTSEAEVVAVGPHASDAVVVGPRASGGGGIFSRVVSLTSRGSSGRSKRSPKGLQAAITAASLVAPTTLEASLLHGITTQTLLHKCAIAFRSQEFDVEKHYSRSFETEELGDFISHDWASGRLSKLLALGLVYNSKAAMISSSIVSVAILLLQSGSDPILPPPRFAELDAQLTADNVQASRAAHYGFWNTVISPPVFVLFFLFWQDLRIFLRLTPKTCFLDKYCIDQANPERKAAGILGLAGFLRCSDRLVILWTPRYFTRLWCTYEVASWLYLQKPMTSVLFMPLAHASIIMTTWLLGTFCFLMLALWMPVLPMYYMHMLFAGLLFGNFVIGHKARRSAMHLRAMKDQLLGFAVTNSRCFCCLSDHMMPTGEQIPCDRKVVYATIAEWFNDPNDDDSVAQETRLDRFDQAVRKHFAVKVLQKVGPSQVPYRFIIPAGWPFFLRMFDLLPAAPHEGSNFPPNIIIMYFFIPFAIFPLWYKFAIVRLGCWVDRQVGRPRLRALDLLVSAVLAIVMTLLVAIMYVPWEIVLRYNLSPFVMMSIAIVVAAMNFLIYPDFDEWSSGMKECLSDIKACFCSWRCCFGTASQSKPRENHKGRREDEEKEEMEENVEKGVKGCPQEVDEDSDCVSIFST